MTEKHMKPLTVDKCKRSENCYSYSKVARKMPHL